MTEMTAIDVFTLIALGAVVLSGFVLAHKQSGSLFQEKNRDK